MSSIVTKQQATIKISCGEMGVGKKGRGTLSWKRGGGRAEEGRETLVAAQDTTDYFNSHSHWSTTAYRFLIGSKDRGRNPRHKFLKLNFLQLDCITIFIELYNIELAFLCRVSVAIKLGVKHG